MPNPIEEWNRKAREEHDRLDSVKPPLTADQKREGYNLWLQNNPKPKAGEGTVLRPVEVDEQPVSQDLQFSSLDQSLLDQPKSKTQAAPIDDFLVEELPGSEEEFIKTIAPQLSAIGFDVNQTGVGNEIRITSARINGRTKSTLPEPINIRLDSDQSLQVLNDIIKNHGNLNFINEAEERYGKKYADYGSIITAPELTQEEIQKQINSDLVRKFEEFEGRLNSLSAQGAGSVEGLRQKSAANEFTNEKELAAYDQWLATGNVIQTLTEDEIKDWDLQRKKKYREDKSKEYSKNLSDDERIYFNALSYQDILKTSKLTETFENDIKLFEEKNNSYISNVQAYEEKVDEVNKQVVNIDERINSTFAKDEDGKIIVTTQREVDLYNSLVNKRNEIIASGPTEQETFELQKQFTILIDDQNKIQETQKFLQKPTTQAAPISIQNFNTDYSKMNQLFTGFKDLGLSVIHGGIELQMLKLSNTTPGQVAQELLNIDITDAETRAKVMEDVFGLVSLKKELDLESSLYEKPLEITDIKSMSDAADWVVGAGINAIPSLSMAFTGPFALPLFFMSGYGSKGIENSIEAYDASARLSKNLKENPELSGDISSLTLSLEQKAIADQITEDRKILDRSFLRTQITQSLFGGAEVAFEGLVTMKLLKGINIGAKSVPNNIIKKATETQAKKIGSKLSIYANQGLNYGYQIGKSGALEGGSEFGTTLVQNFSDIYIQGRDGNFFDIFEGGLESLAQGALVGKGITTIRGAGAFKNAVAMELATKSEYNKLQGILKQIKDLTGVKGLNNFGQGVPLPLQTTEVQSLIEELTLEGETIKNSIISRLGYDLTLEDASAVGEINREIRRINNRMLSLSQSDMSPSQRKAAVNILEQRFKDLQLQRETILTGENNIERNRAEAVSTALSFESSAGYQLYNEQMQAASIVSLANEFNSLDNAVSQELLTEAKNQLESERKTLKEPTEDEIRSRAFKNFENKHYSEQIDKGFNNGVEYAKNQDLNVNIQMFDGDTANKDFIDAVEQAGGFEGQTDLNGNEITPKQAKADMLSSVLRGEQEAVEINGNIIIHKPNSVKNRRTGVVAHEVLHFQARQKFGAEGVNEAGEALLNYLEKNQPDLYAQVKFRIDQNYTEVTEEGDIVKDKEYYEEAMNAMSDVLSDGAKVKPGSLESLRIFANKLLPTKFQFKTSEGNGVYEFVKSFNKEAHLGQKTGAKVIKIKPEVETTAIAASKTVPSKSLTKESKRKLTPEQDKQAQDKVKEIQELQKESEALAEKYNKPFIKGAKQQRLEKELFDADVKATVDSFVEDRTKALYDPIAASNKENVTREQFRESMKSDIKAMVVGEFEAKQPLEKFITSRGYLRANSLAKRLGIASVEEGITKSIDDTTKQIIGEETKAETVTADVAKKPTETTRFNEDLLTTEFKQNNDTSKEAIENKITKTITEAYEGRDVTGFKDLGSPKFPIPKPVAQLYADMFGIKTVEGLTKKAQNFYPRDRDGLRNLQKFLIENSLSDYNRLPKTISDIGKATGIKQTKLGKIMYNDKGVKVGTAKQYRDIMQGKNITLTVQNGTQKGQPIEFNKPVKDISRGDLQQNLKTAWDFHVKNRALETLVPEQGKRIQAGAKFSKTKAITKQEEIFKNPDLIELFKELGQIKDKVQLSNLLNFDSPAINEKTRQALQDKLLEAVKKYKLDTVTIEAGMMASGGKQTFYGRAGGEGKMYSSAPNAISAGIKNPVKFGKTTDGKFLPIKTTGVENWVAKPGRLYYGKNDPAYKTLLDSSEKYDGPTFKRVTPDQAFSKNEKTKDNSIEKSKNNTKVLNHVVNKLTNAVANGMPLEIAGTIIIQSYQASDGLVKIAAPFKYKDKVERYAERPGAKKQQKEGKKYREEHNPPASVVGAYIMAAIKYNAAVPVLEAIKKNYYQTKLSKFNDDLLDQAKLDSKIVEGQTIFDNPISRLAAAGINIQDLINPFTNKSLAEESGVGIDLKIYDKLNKDQQAQASAIQNEQIIKGLSDTSLDVKKSIKLLIPGVANKVKLSKTLNDGLAPDSLKYDSFTPIEKVITDLGTADKALNNGRKLNAPVKKIRVFDFDDTLARSKSMVIVNMPDGSSRKINATEFAAEASSLEAEGAEFDFTEFSKVVEGKKGPLFNVAEKIAAARGTEDIFILTARPANAAGPIKAFMKANGIDIPLKNITGLGDGTAAAKGRWIAGKAAEGYNDFYFADDAIKNVQAVKDVLSQIDVKSKVQQARASKTKAFNTIVNEMISDSAGIETYKKFSAAKAKTIGASKGKFSFLIPASAEDFTGLLYSMLGKGKKGDAQMAFLKSNLIDPYMKAEDSVIQAKISASNDFMELKKQFKNIPTTLETETGVGKFTYQHALRTYIWTQQGMLVPGLSKADTNKLNKFITDSTELQVFADQLINLQKGKPYPKPTETWLAGNLTTDIIGGIDKVNRSEYQQEWRENVDIIFSKENLNKMEAAYGTRWRKALEDSLRRMKAGSNRPIGGNEVTNQLLDWLNNSVGAVMFLNTRSAVLQTISTVNFLNWGDNNIVAAGRAFANQKQYWSDFMKLMNSDYLVERRNGLKINVSESEIADAVKDSKNKPKAAIAFLLSKGFVLTRYADSFAIASGGSTFYRNRIKKYVKEGMDQKLAEQKAFQDFRAVAEESQQSSDPSKISKQQASAAGRVILAWANTPMQYARIQKRAIQDLVNGRGDWKTNVSKVAYYGIVQNLIFNALQQALFALGFGEDEDEEKDPKKKALADKKISRAANGMIDSQLRGLGIMGAATASAKNVIIKLYEEHNKKTPEYEAAAIEALGFSPPLSSKYRKLVGGLKSFSWNRKEMKEKGFSLDNPAYLAGAQIISAVTNIPLDRVIKKVNNLRGMVSNQTETWQKVALGLGWGTYDVGLPYYGGWDKPVDPTPEQIEAKKISDLKKETKKDEQVKMLEDFGLDKKEIKELPKEEDRVKKIIELKEKPKPKKTKSESAEEKLRRQYDSIKAENKPEQVKSLLGFGLTKKQVRALKYEKDRVEKILELMKNK